MQPSSCPPWQPEPTGPTRRIPRRPPGSYTTARNTISEGRMRRLPVGSLPSCGAPVHATDRWCAGNAINTAVTRGGRNRCAYRQHVDKQHYFSDRERCIPPPIGGNCFRHDRSGQGRTPVPVTVAWAAYVDMGGTVLPAPSVRRVCGPRRARPVGARFAMHERWGNRRRRERRRGAAAACVSGGVGRGVRGIHAQHDARARDGSAGGGAPGSAQWPVHLWAAWCSGA